MNVYNNNHKINNLMVNTNNNKAIFMGILIIAATFSLTTSNIIATAFAQGSSNNNVAGCAHTIKVTISKFPKQTAEASTQVTLSSIAPNFDDGKGSISIPGIGSGHVVVAYNLDSNNYGGYVSDLPGQNGVDEPAILSGNAVCDSKDPQPAGLSLPGIGDGAMSITKVN